MGTGDQGTSCQDAGPSWPGDGQSFPWQAPPYLQILSLVAEAMELVCIVHTDQPGQKDKGFTRHLSENSTGPCHMWAVLSQSLKPLSSKNTVSLGLLCCFLESQTPT
jgi:hypothetical protein